MVKGISLSLLLAAAWVAAQVVLVRVRPPASHFRAATFLFAPTLPLLVAAYLATPPDLRILPPALARTPGLLGLANALLFHLLIYCTWMEFYYYVERPLTLRILVEVDRAGAADVERLRAAYRPDEMIRRRLESMRENGHVRLDGGRYVLTPRGRRLARSIARLRALVGLPYYVPTRRR